MKKSLIALAVLAASGAAMAQSSVTLYGIADVWVGSVDLDPGSSTTKMVSGGVSTSRWGMKGSEDLGGGLKAEFQFEQGVNVDDGTVGSGFNRQAWAGLAGGFGSIRFGLNSTPYDDFAAGAHGAFDSGLAPMNLAFYGIDSKGNPEVGMASTKYYGKVANSIKYISPNMGGLQGAFLYALDEKSTAQREVMSLAINYAGGPLGAYLTYQQEEYYNASFDTTFVKGGASYNFGMATVKGYLAQISDLKTKGADVDEWQIAVDVPLSSAMTLSGSYAMADYKNNMETSGFGVALAYSLSKRTTLYAGFGMTTADFDAAGKVDQDVNAYAVGVKHTF